MSSPEMMFITQASFVDPHRVFRQFSEPRHNVQHLLEQYVHDADDRRHSSNPHERLLPIMVRSHDCIQLDIWRRPRAIVRRLPGCTRRLARAASPFLLSFFYFLFLSFFLSFFSCIPSVAKKPWKINNNNPKSYFGVFPVPLPQRIYFFPN